MNAGRLAGILIISLAIAFAASFATGALLGIAGGPWVGLFAGAASCAILAYFTRTGRRPAEAR